MEIGDTITKDALMTDTLPDTTRFEAVPKRMPRIKKDPDNSSTKSSDKAVAKSSANKTSSDKTVELSLDRKNWEQ